MKPALHGWQGQLSVYAPARGFLHGRVAPLWSVLAPLFAIVLELTRWASPGSDGGREAVEEAGRQAAAKHRGRQEPREAGRSPGRQAGAQGGRRGRPDQAVKVWKMMGKR